MWTSTRDRTGPLPRLVTAADLDAAGVDRDVARRAERSGAWSEVLPGAWLRLPRTPTREERREAALAVLGPPAVLTGADAADRYALRDVPDDGRVTVLVPAAWQRDLGPDVRVLRTARLPAPLVLGGLPCAPPGRALLDAVCRWPVLQDVRAAVLAAVADGWADPGDLLTQLDAGPRGGTAHARRAIADAVAGAASAPEAEAHDAVRRLRGLPLLLLNHVVWLDGEPIGQPDGWLRGLGLGYELDSVRHHGSRSALDATLERSARFRRAGLELVHRSPHRLRADRAGFLDELRWQVAARRRLPQPEPPGLRVLPPGQRP